MFRSTSHVRTESAARYVNRLCKHWGHKFEVELTPERGFIDFGDSNCELLAHPDHVLMILNSPDEDSLAHMQNVVAASCSALPARVPPKPKWLIACPGRKCGSTAQIRSACAWLHPQTALGMPPAMHLPRTKKSGSRPCAPL